MLILKMQSILSKFYFFLFRISAFRLSPQREICQYVRFIEFKYLSKMKIL